MKTKACACWRRPRIDEEEVRIRSSSSQLVSTASVTAGSNTSHDERLDCQKDEEPTVVVTGRVSCLCTKYYVMFEEINTHWPPTPRHSFALRSLREESTELLGHEQASPIPNGAALVHERRDSKPSQL